VNLKEEFEYHQAHGKIATLVAARLPTRFRILGVRPGENLVRGFGKAFLHGHFINGGFYFFNKDLFSNSYISDSFEGALEETVLDKLAENSQLVSFPHEGAWQHLDSEKDIPLLSKVVKLNQSMKNG
jgi:glucose-1-phosphate cytidylyltransferase